LSSRIASFVTIDLRRLAKEAPWRGIVGVAAIAYGATAAISILSGISAESSIGDVLYGDTAYRIAQGVLAMAIALGGMWILSRNRRGPACAGLAAALFCFVPLWGLLPEMYHAILSDQFALFLWVLVRYAVPVAIMVWCLREETQRPPDEDWV
jgi:hypothetical protein